jgi:hypothetical protein
MTSATTASIGDVWLEGTERLTHAVARAVSSEVVAAPEPLVPLDPTSS